MSFRQKHPFKKYFFRFLLKRYRFNTTLKKMFKKYPHLTEAKNRGFQKNKIADFGKSPTDNASEFFVFFMKTLSFSTLSNQSKSKSRVCWGGGAQVSGVRNIFEKKLENTV